MAEEKKSCKVHFSSLDLESQTRKDFFWGDCPRKSFFSLLKGEKSFDKMHLEKHNISHLLGMKRKRKKAALLFMHSTGYTITFDLW